MKLLLLAVIWIGGSLTLFIDGYRNPKPGTLPQFLPLLFAAILWPLLWLTTATILFLAGVWSLLYTPYLTWKLRREARPKRRKRK
jgi:hypothetical protein